MSYLENMNYPLADTEPSMCLAQIQPISDTVCQVRSSLAQVYYPLSAKSGPLQHNFTTHCLPSQVLFSPSLLPTVCQVRSSSAQVYYPLFAKSGPLQHKFTTYCLPSQVLFSTSLLPTVCQVRYSSAQVYYTHCLPSQVLFSSSLLPTVCQFKSSSAQVHYPLSAKSGTLQHKFTTHCLLSQVLFSSQILCLTDAINSKAHYNDNYITMDRIVKESTVF